MLHVRVILRCRARHTTAGSASSKSVRDKVASCIVSRLNSPNDGGLILCPGRAALPRLLKKVVTRHLPVTVVPGRNGKRTLGISKPVERQVAHIDNPDSRSAGRRNLRC